MQGGPSAGLSDGHHLFPKKFLGGESLKLKNFCAQ
jgi:hypothetical protein